MNNKNLSERTVRAGISEDVEMYASRHCSAYTHVHTDISTLVGVPHVLNSEHITYRITTVRFHASHSWDIVCLWRRTISCFSHVRQLIPLSPRLLDSTLVVWIWRRAGARGTKPRSCPRLHIKLGHRSKNSAHGHFTRQQGSFSRRGSPDSALAV